MADGTLSLIAFVIPENLTTFAKNKGAVLMELKQQLPKYMIPTNLLAVATFPITSSGKIDKKILATKEIIKEQATSYVPPENEIERKLITIWQELLEIEHILSLIHI